MKARLLGNTNVEKNLRKNTSTRTIINDSPTRILPRPSRRYLDQTQTGKTPSVTRFPSTRTTSCSSWGPRTRKTTASPRYSYCTETRVLVLATLTMLRGLYRSAPREVRVFAQSSCMPWRMAIDLASLPCSRVARLPGFCQNTVASLSTRREASRGARRVERSS